jgi:hypothetical protein
MHRRPIRIVVQGGRRKENVSGPAGELVQCCCIWVTVGPLGGP